VTQHKKKAANGRLHNSGVVSLHHTLDWSQKTKATHVKRKNPTKRNHYHAMTKLSRFQKSLNMHLKISLLLRCTPLGSLC